MVFTIGRSNHAQMKKDFISVSPVVKLLEAVVAAAAVAVAATDNSDPQFLATHFQRIDARSDPKQRPRLKTDPPNLLCSRISVRSLCHLNLRDSRICVRSLCQLDLRGLNIYDRRTLKILVVDRTLLEGVPCEGERGVGAREQGLASRKIWG